MCSALDCVIGVLSALPVRDRASDDKTFIVAVFLSQAEAVRHLKRLTVGGWHSRGARALEWVGRNLCLECSSRARVAAAWSMRCPMPAERGLVRLSTLR